MGLGPELLSGLGEPQVIWRGFWKQGLEQGLEGRKDLGHKMGEKGSILGSHKE